ncbi:MAG: hypothetical protein KME64_33145 [Scytonematopsis contorta HA4267-MV1]|jgi:hypothetical protein|nr:hypothetical protein [Scytonematopsis contorta HA4267-MV1]
MRVVIESNNGVQAVNDDVVVINAGSAAPLTSIVSQDSSNPESVVINAGQAPSWLMTAIQGSALSSQESSNAIDGGTARVEQLPLSLSEKVVTNDSGLIDTSRFDYAIDAGAAKV